MSLAAVPKGNAALTLWETAQAAKRAAAECGREYTRAIAERLADFDFPRLFEQMVENSAKSCLTA